jgi:hypothetical protein
MCVTFSWWRVIGDAKKQTEKIIGRSAGIVMESVDNFP